MDSLAQAVARERPARSLSNLLVVTHSSGDGRAQRFANAVDRNAVENLLEEAGDDHANRFLPRETAGLSVEDQFFVDSAARRSMRAAHVVGLDLQAGNRSARASEDIKRLSLR